MEEGQEILDNRYKIIKKLGSGAFGEIYKVEKKKTGDFLAGDGEQITLLDCSLAPKLYHMATGLKAFKDNAINMDEQFPLVKKYMDAVFARQSFQDSIYPEETIEWGWSNARGN